ncbi:MAG: DUF3795 domain-containing protein [Eubacteriales bacterium]
MSACVLDCMKCDIFLLPTDKEVQAKLIPWFRSKSWLGENEGIEEIIQRKMYCKGCNDKDVWWSDNCEKAKCCKQEKEITNCSYCSNGPCNVYQEWAKQGGKYEEAFKLMTKTT